MGTITNLNPFPPPGLATDSEVADAIANHILGDPHPQYILERLFDGLALPLLFRKPSSNSQFDANTWNPNQGQSHSSSVNVASGSYFLPTGMPPISFTAQALGILIQIEGTETYDLTTTLQFFIGGGVWIRAIGQQWTSFALLDRSNQFNMVQNFFQGISIGNAGSLIKKLLSQSFTIDPTLLASGQPQLPAIQLTINGAAVGDMVYVAPIGADIINTGIWPFEFRSVVTGANTLALYPLNDWTGGSLDLAPFQIRVLVIGF